MNNLIWFRNDLRVQDNNALFQACKNSGKVIGVYFLDPRQFETNKYGFDEPVDGIDLIPTEIDMVIIPLLSFDKKGYRVGYGKGCYDRFLKRCRKVI